MKVVQLRRLEEQLTAIEEMWAEEVIFGAKGIEILNDLRLLAAKVVAERIRAENRESGIIARDSPAG